MIRWPGLRESLVLGLLFMVGGLAIVVTSTLTAGRNGLGVTLMGVLVGALAMASGGVLVGHRWGVLQVVRWINRVGTPADGAARPAGDGADRPDVDKPKQ
ncbi:MAG: hypothetical protein Q8P22_10760 [Chloroflexota bacterium]|nr:hypothetical protein [Chloroflexota bacterium]